MVMPNVIPIVNPDSYTIIKLTNGKECIIDKEDKSVLSKYTWTYTLANNNEYANTTIDGKTISMNRLLMGAPDGMHVDHINSNGLDNRKSNLRIVTASQNTLNYRKRKSTSSEFYGVFLHKKTNTWGAQGTSALTGKRYGLGYYKLEVEAALAYNEFCAKHNPYSKLNLI